MDRINWDWYQRKGPGDELLGELTGLAVAELGYGTGHQAAYPAMALEPARLIGLDSSLTQYTHSQTLYGHVPGLEFVHTDAAAFLSNGPQTLDVAYSIFGALDFSDPQILLAALATALRPGGSGRWRPRRSGHFRTRQVEQPLETDPATSPRTCGSTP